MSVKIGEGVVMHELVVKCVVVMHELVVKCVVDRCIGNV